MRHTSKYLLWMLLLIAVVLTACSGPSPEKIYQQVSESVVEVIVETDNGQKTGSGFFYAPNTIATNYFTIAGMTSGSIQLLDGGLYQIQSILGIDVDKDIALIAVSCEGVPVEIDTAAPEMGETVYTPVDSLWYTSTHSEGLVLTADDSSRDRPFMLVTTPITKENTGGPLINSKGKVIGINSLTHSDDVLYYAVLIKALENLDTNSPYSVSEFHDLTEPYNAIVAFARKHVDYQETLYISELQQEATMVTCNYYNTDDYPNSTSTPEEYLTLTFYPEQGLAYFIRINANREYSVGIRKGGVMEGAHVLATDTNLTGNGYRDISNYKYGATAWGSDTGISDMPGYLREHAFIWMDKLVPTIDSWCKMKHIPCSANDLGLY